jgi:hypothetical protein
MKMKMVRLRNGSEEPEPLVVVTMMSLEKLMQEKPIALYELYQLCLNSGHKLFGNSEEDLGALSLVMNGQVHNSIRNVVLSAFTGKGLEICLVSPVTEANEVEEG